MIKTSVKRPFLVLVCVLMVIVLGIVSFVKMKTDLLPSINLPYIEVITTYPGAAPEKVESDVTELIENNLGTISGVSDVQSQSAENYSLVSLELEDDADIDAAMVKITQKLDQISLPDVCGTPIVMEISADMMATMYTAVTRDDMDITELTKFVNDDIIPELKRVDGVASVSTTGGVTKSVEVRLDQDKIDEVNDKLLTYVNENLSDAKKQIDEGKAALASGQATLNSQEAKLEQSKQETEDKLASATKQLNEALATKAAYETQVSAHKAQIQALKATKEAYEKAIKESYDPLNEMIAGIYAAQAQMGNTAFPKDIDEACESQTNFDMVIATLKAMGQTETAEKLTLDSLKQVKACKDNLPDVEKNLANEKVELKVAKEALKAVKKAVKKALASYEEMEKGKMEASASFGSALAGINSAKSTMEESEKSLEEAEDTFEESVKTARENANLDQLLQMDTLAQLLSAQNFDMPAGYISDDNTQYLLKVGEELDGVDELENLVLTKIDGVGDVKVSDVADVTIVDDSLNNYASLDGNDAVVLAITKSSTAYTSEVSKLCNQKLNKLKKDYENVEFMNIMDQGDYIEVIVNSVLSNLVWGAVFATLVLLLFLWDIRPTIVIAFSIPLSVLLAVVLMYFTDITFNMMSLSGLALGIGMLVDNSVVSIENIYRLRGQGVPAARAAVQGAKQISGAITASTLTTICVFLPILFTDGLSRQLLTEMCLTITYSLVASLIVALTVVPCISATTLKNGKPKDHPIFDKFLNGYVKVEKFCLKRKFVPILLALALLVVATVKLVTMGIVIIPEMGSEQLSASVTMPEDTTNAEDIDHANAILDKISDIDGVKSVGAMADNGTMALLGISGVGSDSVKSISYNVILSGGFGHNNTKVAAEIEDILEDEELEDYSVSESNMDMSSYLGSGLSVKISGKDNDKLLEISEDVMDMVDGIDGFEEITNGQEAGDDEIEIVVDKNKAARNGLTVAQVYQEIASATTTDKDATSVTEGDDSLDVKIVDENDVLTLDNLMDYEIEVSTTNASGEAITKKIKLSDIATEETGKALVSINRDNQTRYISVTATTDEDHNTTLLSRKLQKLIDKYDIPDGYSVEIEGETESVNEIVKNMLLMIILGFIFIYLVMVAQFQSLLSPFIVIFTVPLAFTGGMFGLIAFGEQLSLLSMMGFVILMGVVVNNGIVFVDYVNQMRLEGMSKKDALVAAGRDRMRPILMTALTTILAMSTMIFSNDMGSDMGKGMAIVVATGLVYATLMTLFIVPVLYDIFFRKELNVIDVDED